jgi:probable 2-oxoglutarate dehydrogenase E1 component DHKTD1
MGIAHRGRLNLMVGMLDLDPVLLFAKIKGKSEFAAEVTATGDVAHHLRTKSFILKKKENLSNLIKKKKI